MGNAVRVYFFVAAPKAGNYPTVSFPDDSAQCIISAINQVNSPFYFSIGKTGDNAVLTISGSKRTLSFTNITMVNDADASDTTTLTGT